MSSIRHIRSRLEFIALLDPHVWDVVDHHGVRNAVNTHSIELMTAEAVRHASGLIKNAAQAKAAQEIAHAMIGAAAKGIANSSAEDGDICPPYDKLPEWLRKWLDHHPPTPPPGVPDNILDRFEQPVETLEQLEVAGLFMRSASLTYSLDASKKLIGIAAKIAGGVSKQLEEDVVRCIVKPRPHPHATLAGAVN